MIVVVVPWSPNPARCCYNFTFATSNALPNPISQSQQQQQHSFLSFPYHCYSCSQSQSLNMTRLRIPCSRLQEMSVEESPLQHRESSNYCENPTPNNNNNNNSDADEDDEEEVGISKIQVPRQKHIPVSKSQLLDSILSTLFIQDQDQDAAHHFRLLTS